MVKSFFPEPPKIFSKQGTIHKRTCVETPQQNGIAGRKHRHIFKCGSMSRFQAHLPLTFWEECVITATYLINRISSPSIYNISLFECLYQQAPHYDHLWVFGCLCYTHTTSTHRDKFQP